MPVTPIMEEDKKEVPSQQQQSTIIHTEPVEPLHQPSPSQEQEEHEITEDEFFDDFFSDDDDDM